ncbi:MAG: hypothetical protein K1Y36_13895 [Blastocatellia bacterium]|nr:hypothetical protein [Blastocatellia bacterium]
MTSIRLRFDEVKQEPVKDGTCRVSVQCSHDGRVFVAQREGAAAGDAPLGLAATATLEIIEAFTDSKIRCTLEEFERTTAFGRDLIVLLVRLEHSGNRVQLFGSCRINANDSDFLGGSVRATLDATNRYVEFVQKGQL